MQSNGICLSKKTSIYEPFPALMFVCLKLIFPKNRFILFFFFFTLIYVLNLFELICHVWRDDVVCHRRSS